jgi:hypothetical protein
METGRMSYKWLGELEPKNDFKNTFKGRPLYSGDNVIFLAYSPYFERIKEAYVITVLSVYPLPTTSECLLETNTPKEGEVGEQLYGCRLFGTSSLREGAM